MKRSTDRILTTHTGSLPRPEAPVDLSEAVDDIVRKQVELGIDVVDDGEVSKAGFVAYTNERLAGFEPFTRVAGAHHFAGSRELRAFPEFYAQHSAPGGHTKSMA
jgi:5-methyltetrahydropteroyltriglutamate--homocysteine methyltransferase